MGSYAKIKFMNEQNNRDFEKFKNGNSRAGQLFVSQNKKEQKTFKKNEINLIFFLKCIE